ncbi:phage holin family protein [Georgenia sp. SYP-B2076]|uniref:phage holin family protein n=1 Tax=Georgenia sp. SYP-B2076 TaxID=2495881 RepID=UPI000F8C5D34|nr:phage holin family protein [Georgenia sp. SYP-B2076]
MIRIIIRALIFLASAALGILAATWLLEGDFTVSPAGFVVAVIVFAVAQGVLSPFIAKMTARYAPAFLGGIGLISTFVALLLASLVPAGLAVSGVKAWVLGTLVVWLVTALGTLLLPLVFLREKTEKAGKAHKADKASNRTGARDGQAPEA